MLKFDKNCTLALQKGEVVIMPTDTVYGICARALDKEAVKKLYAIKNRTNKPGTVIANSLDQLVEAGFKRRYLKNIEYLWPNSISVVIPTEVDQKYLDLGKGSIAVRVVGDLGLVNLLSKTGPLLTTSANLPTEKTVTTIRQARQIFGEGISYYCEGGLLDGKPSTIVRVIDDNIVVVRAGAVKIDERGAILST